MTAAVLFAWLAVLVVGAYQPVTASDLDVLIDELLRERAADCEFERGFCRWTNDKDDSFDWKRRWGRTLNKHTGPKGDITGAGFYAYIDSSAPRIPGDIAKLSSKTLQGTKCMFFSYNMHGTAVGSLTIMNSNGDVLWVRKGQQGSQWHSDHVDVSGNNYKVTFIGMVGGRHKSDIALDLVYFIPVPCPHKTLSSPLIHTTGKGSCTFDHGPCGWSNDGHRDNLNWFLGSRQAGVKPSMDHGRNPAGKYFYFQGSRNAGSALLTGPRICGQHCMQFFYHMQGPNMGKLNLYQKFKNSEEDRVWMMAHDQGSEWNEAVIDLGTGRTNCFQMMFEGLPSNQARQGRIALDDFKITTGTCCSQNNKLSTTPKEGQCNFDAGFCLWKQSKKSDFNWQIGTKRVGSHGTGPDVDASGNGSFAFVESSEPRVLSEVARLISVPLKGSWCMHFQYHMFGADVGTLSVYKNDILVWRKKGDHGDNWLDGFVPTGCSDPVYRMAIEATVGGWRGDIAIDEIEFVSGPCPESHSADPSRQMTGTLPEDVQDPEVPLTIGTCTFEDDFCGWVNTASDDSDWTRRSGSTPSEGTGPLHDSSGFGSYMYVEASELRANQTARLEGSALQGNTCLAFYYHMNGEDVGTLRVESRDLAADKTEVIWAREGQQGNAWKAELLQLTGYKYKVAFVAVRGKSVQGDIALDDFALYPGDCLLQKTFWKRRVEQGNCSFDEGVLCSWTNTNRDQFDWTVGSGTTATGNTGPNGDRRGLGKYAFIESSYPRKNGEKAVLTLLGFPVQQCMQFYFNMHGRDIGALRIYQKSQTEQVKIWERIGRQSANWEKARVTIEQNPLTPWIGIEGEIGRGYLGDIAIDDISFSLGACDAPSAEIH